MSAEIPIGLPLSAVPATEISAVVTVETPVTPSYPRKLDDLAKIINPELSFEDRRVLKQVADTDWTITHLDLSTDKDFAAHALALGAPVFHPFGNFMALTFHPDLESMRTVNVAKGREPEQVASLITTREHFAEVFDFSKLPEGLTEEKVMELMDSFYDHSKSGVAGPFGFRGPAADHIPDHLTSVDKKTGVRTVQIIAPGYSCESNELVRKALDKANEGKEKEDHLAYFAVTSANISSHLTGRDEPAHYRIDGIQQDFGDREPGFVIVGHKRPRKIRKHYPHHEPNSTSIVDISRTHVSENGQVSIFLARHGSLADERISEVVSQKGLALIIDESARPSLPVREYPSRIHDLFVRSKKHQQ